MSPWSDEAQVQEGDHQWNPLQYDAIAQFYPWRVFYARSMSRGEIPLWDPHQFCGTPFLANGQSAVLYPLNVVYLFFSPITATTVFAFVHLFFAGIFMYLLMRSFGAGGIAALASGISYEFCAFMTVWLELPTFISAACLLPLALLVIHLAVKRRSMVYGLLAGVVLGIVVLSGHLQIAFYIGFAAFFWWTWLFFSLCRKEGWWLPVFHVLPGMAACFIAAFLISAPQLLPSLELGLNSHRMRAASETGYEAFLASGIDVWRLVTVFIPDFFGSPAHPSNYYYLGSAADYTEYAMYVGILPLIFAILSIGFLRKYENLGFFPLLAVFALATACGTQINAVFYYMVPGFANLGGPHRIVLLYMFAVCVMSGFGLDYFTRESTTKPTRKGSWQVPKGAGWASLAVLVFFLVFLTFFEISDRFLSLNAIKQDYPTLVPVILLTTLFYLLAVLRSYNLLRPTVFGLLITGLIAVDLIGHYHDYNPTCPPGLVYPETELTQELHRLTISESESDKRFAPINADWNLYMLPKDAILPPNAATVYGLYDAQGYDSLYSSLYKSIASRAQGVDSSPPENGNMSLVRRYSPEVYWLADYIISRDFVPSCELVTADAISDFGPYSVYLLDWLPDHTKHIRAWQRYYGFYGTKDELHFIGANRIKVIPSGYGRSAYYADTTYYPGWHAYRAGTEIPLDHKAYVLKTVNSRSDEQSAATGDILFVYAPFAFKLGLFLCLLGVGITSGLVTHRIIKNRKRSHIL